MTEFDFDELDRAVNNLMGDVDISKRNEALDDPVEKTLALESPDATAPTQEVQTPDASERPQMPDATATPLAAKRRGRFMDVIHPSSDMTQATAPQVKHESSLTIEPPVTQSDETSSQNELSSVDSQSVAQTDQTESVSIMPDVPPLETETQPEISMQPDADTPNPADTGSAMPDESPESAADMPTEVATTVAQPTASPFLPDAKVEKRPLGTPTQDSPAAPNGYAANPEANNPDDVAVPQATEPEIPHELSPEVVSVEMHSTLDQDTTPSTTVAAQTVAADDTSTPTPQPNLGMFDTDAYHKPLEHPTKKRSGWTVVLWILVLLIVGALAGAAYFYFTTQM